MNNEKMAQFISELRKQKSMTQRDLAEQLGVTDKAVSKWERGLSCPDISLLQKLSSILGINVAELLNGERTEVSAPEVEVMVETTLKYADAATKTVIDRSKGWKYVAIVSIISLLSIFVLYICNISIDEGIVLGIPIWLALFVWLAAILGAYITGKQRIASVLVCAFTIFILTYYYSSLNVLPTRDIDGFNGFPRSYIPQYTIVLILFNISIVLAIITFLIQRKKISDDKIFPLMIASVTVIIMSMLTISSIVDYVDLNFFGVDSRFTIFIFITIGANILLLALIARRQIKMIK